jgi:hypothetical protein
MVLSLSRLLRGNAWLAERSWVASTCYLEWKIVFCGEILGIVVMSHVGGREGQLMMFDFFFRAWLRVMKQVGRGTVNVP